MIKEKKPNFFIVGAPKCGTTALATYLNDHHEIFISDPKEPHYFADDFSKYQCCNDEKQYFDLFNNMPKEIKAIGEASVFYLYSMKAIENIYNYNSNAKLIVMLRNPIEMIHSLHSQLFYTADEDIILFSEAWKLEKNRKMGKNIPMKCREPKLLYYSEIAKYDEQLQRIYNYFPKSQVKVIIFDDFKKSPLNVYKEVLNFLDLDYDGRIQFDKINENKQLKSVLVNNLIIRPPRIIVNFIKYFKIIFGIKEIGLFKKIRNKNTVIVKREQLEDHLKKEIYLNYEDSINNLSSMLNRELSVWKYYE